MFVRFVHQELRPMNQYCGEFCWEYWGPGTDGWTQRAYGMLMVCLSFFVFRDLSTQAWAVSDYYCKCSPGQGWVWIFVFQAALVREQNQKGGSGNPRNIRKHISEIKYWLIYIPKKKKVQLFWSIFMFGSASTGLPPLPHFNVWNMLYLYESDQDSGLQRK